MKQKGYMLLVCLFLGAFILTGISDAVAPVEEEKILPDATVLPVNDSERLQPDADVYQTMYFLRCNHSISRRTKAAQDVQGATFDEVRQYYDVWTLLTLSTDHVRMERQIDLYCPMHKVLFLDRAGQIVLAENRYGDGMAILKIYEGTSVEMTDEVRGLLVAGQGFDSESDAHQWLQERKLVP